MKKQLSLLVAALPMMVFAQDLIHLGTPEIVDGKVCVPVIAEAGLDGYIAIQTKISLKSGTTLKSSNFKVTSVVTDANAAWAGAGIEDEIILSFTAPSTLVLDSDSGGSEEYNLPTGKLFYIILPNENDEVVMASLNAYDYDFNDLFDGEIDAQYRTIGEGGYSTYSNLASAVEVMGATAYSAVVEDNVAKMSEIADNIIPSGEGAILKGEKGDVALCVATTTSNTIAKNDLTASNNTEVNGNYVLATVDGATHFYKFSGSHLLAPGKSFIDGSLFSASRLVLDFDGDVNGIEVVDTEVTNVVFDLQGNKQQKIQKGINIVNGKKVMY